MPRLDQFLQIASQRIEMRVSLDRDGAGSPIRLAMFANWQMMLRPVYFGLPADRSVCIPATNSAVFDRQIEL